VSKIIPALQSRCTRFRFAPLPSEDEVKRLKVVIDSEKYGTDEEHRLATHFAG
jgi:replication factor C subunit 3/5